MDATNLRLYGASLAVSGQLEWGAAQAWNDDRAVHGELSTIVLLRIWPKIFLLYSLIEMQIGKTIVCGVLGAVGSRQYPKASQRRPHYQTDT